MGLQIQGHPFLAKPISIPELVAGIERIGVRTQRPDDEALLLRLAGADESIMAANKFRLRSKPSPRGNSRKRI